MNYLAHLRLAPDDPLLQLGNLLGDFRRGVAIEELPAPLRRGVEHHMSLDRFTDGHAVFRRSRARLDPPFHRLSAVLIDVFYDHFLASGWDRWGDGRTLAEFTSEMYGRLDQHRDLLPGRLGEVAPFMAAQDWLGTYAKVSGVDLVLERMSRRMRRSNSLGRGGEQLRAHYDELRDDFEEFFPAAIAHAAQWP